MEDLLTLIVVIAIAVLLFFACREIICWYFKINERIRLLEEQNALLKKLLGSGPDHVS